MTTAKVNTQFDYVSLRIKFDGKKTLNVTRSRNGIKLSGTEATRPALDFLDAWFKQRKNTTIGQSMEHLCGVAQKSNSIHEFLTNA